MTSKALLVGSGVIGLRTALELLRRNVSVTLRSSRPPWDISTCSHGAGGLWMPYHCDDSRTDRWALETLESLLAMKEEQKEQLVEIVPAVSLKRHHQGPTVEDFVSPNVIERGDKAAIGPLPSWSQDPRLAFQHMTVEMLQWQNRVLQLRIPSLQRLYKAGYMHAWLFHPPIVDAPRMLMSMLQEIQSHPVGADVDVETGYEYESVNDMVQDAVKMGCDIVVNCTGLGASKVCNDSTLVGARGILLHYDRQQCRDKHDSLGDAVILAEEAPWGSEAKPCYLIPRGDVLVVGGSYLEGDKEAGIRPEERDRLVQNAQLLGIDTTQHNPVSEWTGFRPYRKTVRCEIDDTHGEVENVRVVHSYGYGGSGWTVFVGAAMEAANLVTDT